MHRVDNSQRGAYKKWLRRGRQSTAHSMMLNLPPPERGWVRDGRRQALFSRALTHVEDLFARLEARSV